MVPYHNAMEQKSCIERVTALVMDSPLLIDSLAGRLSSSLVTGGGIRVGNSPLYG